MKRLIITIGTVFAILFVFGINGYAQDNVIHGCFKKSGGDLRILARGTSCNPSETPISWNLSGPQGPAGPTGPPGPQGPEGKSEKIPRVYDSNGQFLGILPSDSDGFLLVLIPALSKFIFISPDDGDIYPFYPAVYLYFADNACAGDPYLDTSMRYLVFKLGANYYQADNVPAQSKTINSLSSPMWDGSRLCRPAGPTNMPVLPSKPAALPFATPVALPLYFDY